MADAVVRCESAQRFARGPPLHQCFVGRQSPQPRTITGSKGVGDGVVVERTHQDRRVDVPEDVVERAQPRSLDHRIDATPIVDGGCCELVAPAAQVFAQSRPSVIALIEPRCERITISSRQVGTIRAHRTGERRLFLSFSPDCPLHAPLRRAPRSRRSLLSPPSLKQLPPYLLSGEVATESCVRHAVVGCQRAQRLAGCLACEVKSQDVV